MRLSTLLLVTLALGCREKDASLDSTDDTASESDDTAPLVDLDGDGHPATEDCDDQDPDVHPGATEQPYNGVDDDCDPATPDDDLDGDGYPAAEDCDDEDPTLNPGATEQPYNGVDDDCDPATPDDDLDDDGFPTSMDCDDEDAGVNPDQEEIPYDGLDNDCDAETLDDDLDGDGYPSSDDCDDQDPELNPGASEVCDGVDNDCDGISDEADAADASTWYPDSDGDGFGDDANAYTACEASSGSVSVGGDCDDSNAAYNPLAAESDCTDPNDYNCDGSTGYDDLDGDGYPACEECDDSDASINPDGTEVCDGTDNDCDGLVDDGDDSLDSSTTSNWYPDSDGDGFGDPSGAAVAACAGPTGTVADNSDCDDSQATVNPGEVEVCDGLDNDCDGASDDADSSLDASTTTDWYPDGDGDGYGDSSGTATASCDAPSGSAADHSDCDDADPSVNPGASEVCDSVDNDCDGLTDDDDRSLDTSSASSWFSDGDGDGYGDSASGQLACDQPSGTVSDDTDCDDADAAINPGASEVCDSVDNDCDGLVDGDDDSLDTSSSGGIWYTDGDGDGYGDPATAEADCTQPSGTTSDGTDCDDLDAAINPGATEICDGVDNDCDGDSDDADSNLDTSTASSWYGDGDGDGYGESSTTTLACEQPSGYAATDDDCDDTDGSVYPLAGDVLGDGLDQDCDGLDCEADWTGNGQAYFAVCLDAYTWADAQATCQGAGHDDLASVHNTPDQNGLMALLNSSGGQGNYRPWIGLNDQATEGTWEWSSGWTGGFRRWASGEPSGGGSEDCAVLDSDMSSGLWGDEDCADSTDPTRAYTCETRLP